MAEIGPVLEHQYARRIGSRIRELREARRWTQRDLAHRLDVYGREVSRWESGDQLPPVRRLLHLAETFGVEPGELFGKTPGARSGGLGSRLQAAHRRWDSGIREAVTELFEVFLALMELDPESIEGLAGALEVIEGAARQRREAERA